MRRNHWFGVAVLLCLLGTGAPDVEAKGSVRITFNTVPTAPLSTYTPNNVVALWIQNGAGQHVRTVGLWSAVRTQHLVAYATAAGTTTEALAPDAVSGASRVNHQDQLLALWNLKDKLNQVVPDGTYTIRLEFAEGNSTAANQNNSATFTFVKGPNPQVQSNLAGTGFSNVTIDFDPDRVACGDGFTDMPETCDYAQSGSCIVNQSGCPGVVDKCMPQVFQGDPMQCTATCVVQPITTCVDGDMCCAAGCDESTDSDCGDGGNPMGGGSGDDTVTGGCSTGAGGGLAMFALFALVFVRRRR